MAEPQEQARHAYMAEARRRAAILKRYVAIERPSAETDQAFAAELGLSVDSLVRMATAWRRLGEARSLQGSRYRPSQLDRFDALDSLERGTDLSVVPASRRKEVRRRLQAIRRFLRIGQPSAMDTAKAAKGLGMTAPQFSRMVRTWVIHKSAAAVPGAYAARRPRRKNTAKTDTIQLFIRRALDELGAEAQGGAIHERVVELCRDNGIEPLTLSRTYQLLRALRGGRTRRAGAE